MSENDQDLWTLRALCNDGDIEGVQKFVEQTLPSLPYEVQKTFCCHSTRCRDLLCTASIIHLSEGGAQGGHVAVFAYLWDTYLAPRGIKSISWSCLQIAATQGAIPLGQAYWSRDPDCFKTRSLQVETAIRRDRFEYIDFMLAHGADINAGFPSRNLLKVVVTCAVDDATTLQRIQFLVSRGAKVAGSGALREAVAADNIELASYLLDSGAEVDDVADPEKTSSLMVAASEGHRELVEFLLGRGANTELVDREGRDAIAIANRSGHDYIAKILQAHEYINKYQYC